MKVWGMSDIRSVQIGARPLIPLRYFRVMICTFCELPAIKPYTLGCHIHIPAYMSTVYAPYATKPATEEILQGALQLAFTLSRLRARAC
jgi:hypothetical protein